MATKVFMEALSPTMEEGRLAKWVKNEGDAVKTGDVLAEVETEHIECVVHRIASPSFTRTRLRPGDLR